MTGDESEPLIITVTSDWEVKQTSSLVTGAVRCGAMRCDDVVCHDRVENVEKPTYAPRG